MVKVTLPAGPEAGAGGLTGLEHPANINIAASPARNPPSILGCFIVFPPLKIKK
jgi:hypothetical protein